MHFKLALLRCVVVTHLLGAPSFVLGKERDTPTIVVSRVFNGYERSQRMDGSFAPETYAFAVGGRHDGQAIARDSISSLSSDDLLRTLAVPLARQGYVASNDPDEIKLLLIVFWGTTLDTSGNQPVIAADLVEAKNARILGFEQEVNRARDLFFTTFASDIMSEVRAGRYFVVIRAFDFQHARNHQQLRLLWESRFSIRRQGSDFVAQLPRMAALAAPSFGRQNSGRLERAIPEGRVEVGEAQVIGDATEESRDDLAED
jgi:hypothetical protein